MTLATVISHLEKDSVLRSRSVLDFIAGLYPVIDEKQVQVSLSLWESLLFVSSVVMPASPMWLLL